MYRECTLANGLRVIAEERRGVPLVTVWSVFGTGSGDEVQGLTGASHFCEHMNFKKSRAFPGEGDIDAVLAAWGGHTNGYTWLDTTAHYSIVLSAGLDDALRVEAERMHAMRYDAGGIEAERGVIIAEHEGGRNDPETLLCDEVQLAAFTAHGYRWPTIGMAGDLRTMTAEALREFHARRFVPRNAVLVVAGDFEWPDLIARIRRRFGRLPGGAPPPRRRTAEEPPRGQRRVTVRDVGEVPYLAVAYHAPGAGARDLAGVLALRGVLAGGDVIGFGHGSYGSTRRSSRLYRALVEPGIAARVKCVFSPARDPYLLTIVAALHRAKDFDRAERVLARTLRTLARRGPGAGELACVKAEFAAAFAEEEESIEQVADNLGYFASIGRAGMWRGLRRAVLCAGVEDVRAAAARYCTEDDAVIGRFVPQPAPRPVPAWVRMPPAPAPPPPVRSRPRLPAVRAARLPDFDLNAETIEASCGLRIVVAAMPRARTASLRLLMPAGCAHQGGGEGLAELAARSVLAGSARYGKRRLWNTLDRTGAWIAAGAGKDAACIVLSAPGDALPILVPVLFSLAREPLMPAGEVAEEHRRMAHERASALEDPAAVAGRRLVEALYRGHPYAAHALGPDAGFALDRAALRAFRERTWRPEGSTLVACGACEASALARMVERAARGWRGAAPQGPLPAVRARAPRVRRAVLPGKPQADVAFGRLLPPGDDPAVPAIHIAEHVLGRIVLMGRLGARLRTERGLAYYATSHVESLAGARHVAIHAGVDPRRAAAARREIAAVLRRLCAGGASAREIDLAKAAIVAGLIEHAETAAGRADLLADLAARGLPVTHAGACIRAVKAAPRAAVNAAAARFFDPRDFEAVIAGAEA